MKPESEIVEITPKRAAELLEATKEDGVRNRTVTQTRVDFYATQMREGKWELNGESIVLDEDGNVLDGQHRLWACVTADVPFKTAIVTGVDRKSFGTIDTGRARKASDVLSIFGYKNTSNLAAALSWIYLYECRRMMWSPMTLGWSNAKAAEMIEKHPKMQNSVDWAMTDRFRVSLPSPPASTAFLHYIYSKIDQDKTEAFFAKVGDLVPDAIDSPTRLLRRTLNNRERSKKRVQRVELLALHVKALNAHMCGKTLTTLRWVRSGANQEDFPVFFGEKETRGKSMKAYSNYTIEDSQNFIKKSLASGPKRISNLLTSLERRGMPHPWVGSESSMAKSGIVMFTQNGQKFYKLIAT